VDILDGHINKAMFRDPANSWRKAQTRILDEIALHPVADQCCQERSSNVDA
jgi:hypothetical protein